MTVEDDYFQDAVFIGDSRTCMGFQIIFPDLNIFCLQMHSVKSVGRFHSPCLIAEERIYIQVKHPYIVSQQFFPPIVTGPIIISIGLTLSQTAVDNCARDWLGGIWA